MGLRETLNNNQGIVVAAVILLVAIAAYVLLFAGPDQPGLYYTTDDGESYFEHEPVMPPFSHRGSEAVQAMVFTCDGGQTRFVGYLMKYRDEATRAAAQAALENRTQLPDAGLMVKRPGDAEWVPAGGGVAAMMSAARDGGDADGASALSAAEIRNPRCPEGTSGPLINVTPASEF